MFKEKEHENLLKKTLGGAQRSVMMIFYAIFKEDENKLS